MSDLYQVMPPLTEDEYASLREDIMIRGVLVPVEKDESGNILDGHHRVRICEELGIKDYPVTIRPGLTEADKRNHARAINILRRQLDATRRAPLMAQLRSEGWSFRRIAEAAGVNEKTVRNDLKSGADYSAPETPAKTIGKDGKVYPANSPARGMPFSVFATSDREAQKVISLAAANPSLLDGLGEGVNFSASDITGMGGNEKVAHVSHNSGENEWYTPAEYIEAARQVLGVIELDPASSEIANRTVQAERFITKEQDALSQPWQARTVWMNPPYSGELVKGFAAKFAQHILAGDVSEGIVLVNNATETKWFSEIISACSAVVFPTTRIRFLRPQGNPGAPLQGQAILYAGRSPSTFLGVFEAFGWGAYIPSQGE